MYPFCPHGFTLNPTKLLAIGSLSSKFMVKAFTNICQLLIQFIAISNHKFNWSAIIHNSIYTCSGIRFFSPIFEFKIGIYILDSNTIILSLLNKLNGKKTMWILWHRKLHKFSQNQQNIYSTVKILVFYHLSRSVWIHSSK